MDYEEAVSYLDRHIGLGVRPGLERISALLELMAHPEQGYPIIHVAGSNGKTSTSRLATSILAAHGMVTGTFISPHLERIEERISINGNDATREEFAAAVADVQPFADLLEERIGEAATYFELTAAIAFSWFLEKAADAAVIEVGLGGRLDATNAATGQVAVVTSISLEHTSYLGDTIEKIAREKLAIAKEGSVIVLGNLPAEALREGRTYGETKGLEMAVLGSDFRVAEAEMAVGGWHLAVEGLHGRYDDIFLPAHGRHQTWNLAAALAAVEAFLGRGLDPEAVRQGVAVTRLPGRLEVVGRRPLVLLDGAHNEEGFGALARALEEEFTPLRWTVVMGSMGDKSVEGMLAHLAGRAEALIVCAADSPRALPTSELARHAKTVLGDGSEILEADSVPDAVDMALSRAGGSGAVLVVGSLYVVGEARSHLR